MRETVKRMDFHEETSLGRTPPGQVRRRAATQFGGGVGEEWERDVERRNGNEGVRSYLFVRTKSKKMKVRVIRRRSCLKWWRR